MSRKRRIGGYVGPTTQQTASPHLMPDQFKPSSGRPEYLFGTCDCTDYLRNAGHNVMTGRAFINRNISSKLVTIATEGDDAAHVFSVELDLRHGVDDFGFLLWEPSSGIWGTVTRTDPRPYKREKKEDVREPRYHYVQMTTEAIEQTDWVCKHIMTLALAWLQYVAHPGKVFTSVWLGTARFADTLLFYKLNEQVGLIELDKPTGLG